MRSLLFVLTLMGVLCASTAQASVLGSLIQNEVTKLEDVDYEIALDGGDGSLDVGDYLLAVIEFGATRLADDNSLVFDASQTTEAITAVSLVRVASVTGAAGVATFGLTGVTGAEWLSEAGVAGVTDGTALIAYLDPVSAPSDHVVNTTVAAGVTSATEGTFLYEFGIDNFFTATALDLAGGTFDATNIANIESLSTLGDFSVISQAASAPLLVEHDFLTFGFGGSQLQLSGSLESQGGAGAFDIVTDSDVYVFAVPEPTSLLGFAGLFGLALAGRRRRA